MRVMVKRLLRKYKYPPEKTQGAIDIVIKQAELMSSQIAVLSRRISVNGISRFVPRIPCGFSYLPA